MGITVVENPVRTIWMPVDYNNTTAATVYEGSIVVAGYSASCEGVKVWNIAGTADTTADQVPFGVVVGTNDAEPTYNSTYKGSYIAGVSTQAAQLARNYRGVEGMHGKGDPLPMVKVAVIGPNTVLKAPIFTTTYGTGCTVSTVTTGSTTGLGYTGSTVGFTPVAYNATHYCRSGANKGIYRVSYDTSATVHTFYQAFPYDIAIGDTFVAANVSLGTCYAMFDTTSCAFLNNAAAVTTTNYAWIDVLELNLEKANEEYAIFKINPVQFAGVRA
jgi:hypothetical protein